MDFSWTKLRSLHWIWLRHVVLFWEFDDGLLQKQSSVKFGGPFTLESYKTISYFIIFQRHFFGSIFHLGIFVRAAGTTELVPSRGLHH